MISRTSRNQRSADEFEKGRKRFASPSTVFATGLGIILVMYFIFPRPAWFRQLNNNTVVEPSADDNVRITMIRDLIARKRGGLAMYENYARQLGIMGDYQRSYNTLDSLFSVLPPDSVITLRKLEAEISLRLLNSAPPPAPDVDSLARRHLEAALESYLTLPASPAMLNWAANTAVSIGNNDLALRLYLELARRNPSQSAFWYSRASEVAIGQGNYLFAADLFFQLQGISRNPAEKKMFFLQGLRILQSGNQLDSALAHANRDFAEWRYDSEVLMYLIKLSRAANRTKDAEQFAHLLISVEAGRGKSHD